VPVPVPASAAPFTSELIMPLLFSYGSNHPKQLSERIGRRVKGAPAFAPGMCRVFRGWSQRWEGGVASLEAGACTTFGYVAKVTEDELRILDQYEGIASGNYRRSTVKVTVGAEEKSAIAYIATSRKKSKPSEAYLEAVALTIGTFWSGEGGPVRVRDIPIR